jgi:hypothetical protein
VISGTDLRSRRAAREHRSDDPSVGNGAGGKDRHVNRINDLWH